jgi:hypothetical protein
MWNFFSSIFIVFAFMGFGTFMPKYVEYQFRSDALNYLSGRWVAKWKDGWLAKQGGGWLSREMGG